MHISRAIRLKGIWVLALLAPVAIIWTSCKNTPGEKGSKSACDSFFDSYTLVTPEDRAHLLVAIDSFLPTLGNSEFYCIYRCQAQATRLCMDMGNYYRAVSLADSCIAKLEYGKAYKNYLHEYLDAIVIRGEVAFAMNRESEGFDYLFKAQLIARERKDACYAGQTVYTLAMMSYRKEKYRNAIDYFVEANRQFITCNGFDGDSAVLQMTIDNIGLCYERLGIPDSALFMFDSALRLINSPNAHILPELYQRQVSVIYGNKGGVLLASDKIDSAIVNLERSYNINIAAGFDNHDALLTHIKLLRAYIAKGDLRLADNAIWKINKEKDTIAHTAATDAAIYKLISSYQVLTGKPAEAIKSLNNYIAISDSTHANDKKAMLNDVAVSLAEKDQAYRIGTLQKQAQTDKMYVLLSAALAVMAFAIVLLIGRNYRKSRRHIRELTRLNGQVSAQKTELELRNHEKDRIMHVVAHDLRNPISGIGVMTSRMITREEDTGKKKQLEIVERTAANALELIKELLEDASEIGAATRQTTGVTETIQRLLLLMQERTKQKQLSVRFDAPSEELHVCLPADKLLRLLGNILDNAIKFSPEGNEIAISLSQSDKTATVAIADSGIGIPRDVLEQIFDNRGNTNRSGTSGERSYGLGLSICKEIAEEYGGHLSVKSEVEIGSTFYISLPSAS